MRKLTETPLSSGTLKKSLLESVAMKRGIDGRSHESLLPLERFVWTVGVESRIPQESKGINRQISLEVFH